MDLSGWIGVGLGGNCDCRCGILYAPTLVGWGGGFCNQKKTTPPHHLVYYKHNGDDEPYDIPPNLA